MENGIVRQREFVSWMVSVVVVVTTCAITSCNITNISEHFFRGINMFENMLPFKFQFIISSHRKSLHFDFQDN
jgi:hypothetical protein